MCQYQSVSFIFALAATLLLASCGVTKPLSNMGVSTDSGHGALLSPTDPLPEQTNFSPSASDTASPDSDTEPETKPASPETTPDDPPAAPVTDTPPPTPPPSPDATLLTLGQDGIVEWTVRGDSGSKLNLVAQCEASQSEGGKLLVSINLFLEHWQLNCSSKWNCTLSVGGEKQTFSTSPIVYGESAPTMTYLSSIEVPIGLGESFDIAASFPFRGTYSGIPIETLTLSGCFAVIEST